MAESFVTIISDMLTTSADNFVWAMSQIPPKRMWAAPPHHFGTWPAARQAYHVWNYDRNLAIPGIKIWLGDPPHSPQQLAAWYHEDELWTQADDVERLLTQLRQCRQEQIALLQQLDEVAWDTLNDTLWGHVTLRWVVMKIWQHTLEHTTTVMQMALFW